MKRRYPNRKEMASVVSAVVLVTVPYQILRGWDTRDFCLRLLFCGLAVLLAWRCRTLVAKPPAQAPGAAFSGFIWAIVFWVVAAIAFFFAFRAFQ